MKVFSKIDNSSLWHHNAQHYARSGSSFSYTDAPAKSLKSINGSGWALIAAVVVIGYLCMTRSFAYIGIRAINLYIGEVVLGIFLLFKGTKVIKTWIEGLVLNTKFSLLAWTYYMFLAYGIVQAVRGIAKGFPALIAIQSLIFHIYPLYIFIGIWVGRHNPWLLKRLFKWQGWLNGIYGIIYVTVLNSMAGNLSQDGEGRGNGVAIFGQPAGSGLTILGILCFASGIRQSIIPLMLNSFVLLAIQVRAEWLGFAIAFFVWGVLSKKIRFMFAGVAAISVLLAVGYIADFKIPAPAGRGGYVSTSDIIGRALSTVDREGASKYSSHAESSAGTVEWRTLWWRSIWNSVHENTLNALIGHGYGYPLTSLVSYMEGNTSVRSPHSIFFYCLGYGGWFGVALFFMFHLTLLHLHWKTYKLTKQPFGIGCLLISFSSAFFGNFFETPFGAIPYYLLTGLAVAPLFNKTDVY